MTPPRIYLDHNATTALRPQARDAMMAVLERTGNAASIHAEGRFAHRLIERAREQVAALVGTSPGEIVFTSGGTEANNSVLAQGWDTCFVSAVEHESVLEPARHSKALAALVPVTNAGAVDLAALDAMLTAGQDGGARRLLSLQLANNETGVLHPVAEAADLAHRRGFLVHSDAVQACGKVPVSCKELNVDFMTLSAHKIGGPQGVGALVARDGVAVAPLLRGGGQEMRARSGTSNVAGIVGFGAAAEAAGADLSNRVNRDRALRDHLESGVTAAARTATIISWAAPRLPNTSCIALPGLSSETLVIALDLAGVAVSAGAACSSGKIGRSHVLDAMGLGQTAGLDHDLSRSAIRISLGWNSTAGDVESFLEIWRKMTMRLTLESLGCDQQLVA